LGSAGELVLPPGGVIFPELRKAGFRKADRLWTGSIRLFRRSRKGPEPTRLVVNVEVVEHPDQAVDVRLVDIVEAAPPRRYA
jgi:hypothetical protein